MRAPTTTEIGRLLDGARDGNREALDRIVSLLYDELRELARRQLRRERPGHTLGATGLVHEAWARLAGANVPAQDRSHFLALAARAMRQVLVDHARRNMAHKRGGSWKRTTLGDRLGSAESLDPEEIIALDAALESLEPRQRQVVECRFFGGMEEKEIAAVLGVTERTVRRDWVKARAWLYRELYGDAPAEAPPLDA